MTDSDAIKLLLMLSAVGAVILLARIGGSRFAQLLEDFADSFRGGPRPPAHPLPAKDSAIVRGNSV